MRIKALTLNNIGPFIEATLDFNDVEGQTSQVVLITGENGTGKSIILDAIRGMFGQRFVQLERDVRRRGKEAQSKIKLSLLINKEIETIDSASFHGAYYIETLHPGSLLQLTPKTVQNSKQAPHWVVDYWSSALASGTYRVNTLSAPQHEQYLNRALQGQRTKENITQLICHFDYLRDSKAPAERATGECLYAILEQIIADSLLNGGHLSHVARTTYDPIVVQNGQPVPLANLSGGNSYLIQNMVSLLSKMYSVHFLNQIPLDELCNTPGLLLIDEAENQLHPKWQKHLIDNILKIFPNLQIIATTHSPFIVASAPQAQLFVCQAHGAHCTVTDVTAEYANKPIDEILMSPLFEATQPFNSEITALLEQRAEAIQNQDTARQKEIETALQSLNPTYFSYFDIETLLDNLSQETVA